MLSLFFQSNILLEANNHNQKKGKTQMSSVIYISEGATNLFDGIPR